MYHQHNINFMAYHYRGFSKIWYQMTIDAILPTPPPPKPPAPKPTPPPPPKQAKSRQSNFRAAKFKTCHFDN